MKIVRERADLPVSDEIYVFGAGRGGRIVAGEIRKIPGARIVAFIDNQKRGEVDGVPVIGLDEFAVKRTERSRLVIASMYVLEIVTQLRHNGVRDFDNAYPLIEGIVAGRARRARLLRGVAIAAAIILIAAIGLWTIA